MGRRKAGPNEAWAGSFQNKTEKIHTHGFSNYGALFADEHPNRIRLITVIGLTAVVLLKDVPL